MHKPAWLIYDTLYYDYRLAEYRISQNLYAFRYFFLRRFDKEFYRNYRQVVKPFWKEYGVRPPLYWIKHCYSISHSLDPRCIPRGIWFGRILPYFNSPFYTRQLRDKNLYHLLFRDTKRPETIYKFLYGEYCRDDLTHLEKDEAFSLCLLDGDYIIKPSVDSFEGNGIQRFRSTDGPKAIMALLEGYTATPHIVQRVVVQHPALAAFNPSSFNTIRLVTLVLNGKVHILSSILRIGAEGNVVDNVSKGGYQCTIRPDGTLENLAYTSVGEHFVYAQNRGQSMYVEQTHTGARFEGFRVPSWERILETARSLALRLPYMKLIGWDLGVDENGEVVLIEFNTDPEQNESTCGPSFGEITDEVLTEVFLKNRSHSVLSRLFPAYFPTADGTTP